MEGTAKDPQPGPSHFWEGDEGVSQDMDKAIMIARTGFCSTMPSKFVPYSIVLRRKYSSSLLPMGPI